MSLAMAMAMAATEREPDTDADGGGGNNGKAAAGAAGFSCQQDAATSNKPQPAQTLHLHVDLGNGSRKLVVTSQPESVPNQEMKDPYRNPGHHTHHLSQTPSPPFCSNSENYVTVSSQSPPQNQSHRHHQQHGEHCARDPVPLQHANMASDHLMSTPHLASGHSHPRQDDNMDECIPSDDQSLPPASHHGHDQQQQQQQQQRPRQDSLASDWRFPSAASMRSPQSPQSPRSPRSPGGYRPYTPGGPSSPLGPRALAVIPRLSPAPVSNPRHDPWQAPSGSGAASSPSSPATRRRRGAQLRQNTDPLVYHRLISSNPTQNTQTFSSGPSHSYQQSLPGQQHFFDSLLSSPTQLQHRHITSSPSRPVASAYHHHHHLPPQRSPPCDDDILSSPADLNSPLSATFHLRQYDTAECHEPQNLANTIADTALVDQYLPTSPILPNGPGPLRCNPPSLRSEFLAQSRPAASSPVSVSISPADAVVTPTSSFPPSPIRSPTSPTFPGGQHPHPLVSEQGTARFDYEPLQVPRHDRVDSLTASGQVDKMYRPDSRQSGDTAFGSGLGGSEKPNFSRPRKNSLRGFNRPDFSAMYLRPGTALSTASDSVRLDSHTMNSSSSNNYAPYQSYNPSRPRRRPSASSNMSTSTFASATPSLRHHASEDRLGGASRNVSQTAATGQFMGPPHIAHPQGPPRYYTRGGPPAPNQQSQLYEDEMRSSLRSHLTASTAQETLFTEPERSSVITKTSSVISSGFRNTRQSSFFGPHNPSLEVRDSLSVDDVMGMYENGFNDSDFDLARRMSGMELQHPEMPPLRLAPHVPEDYDNSRPGTAMSHNSTEAASRLLEAMSQTSPMPIPGRSFPLNGEGTKVLRDTNAFFRKSLASSLPKDMRLSFISTRSRMADEDGSADEEEAVHGEDDIAGHSRHDSGKMVGHRSDDDDDDILIPDPEKAGAGLISRAEIPEPPRNNGRLSPQPPPKSETAKSQPSPAQLIQGAAQPEDLDPNANDRYGFRKANQYITRDQYDEWNGPYSEYLARRRKKWEAFLKENGLITDRPTRFPQHSAKAKRFVRKGIPPDWRGAAWFYYAGGPKILAHNQGVYADMLKRAKNGQLNEVCRDDIERDLYRTFPDNVRFRRTAAMQAQNTANPTPLHSRTNSTQSANPQPRPPGSEPEIIDQLRRVLSAFAVFNPNIGYCQSLNFLGGMLLLFVESEEHAFWLLNIITRVYLPGTHEMNLEGSKVDLSVLMAELQDVLPHVWTRISDDGSAIDKTRKRSRRHRNHHKNAAAGSDLPPVTLALTAWFMSCFIGTLPVETTLRVWDVFFYEGSKTLFRVALAIFKAGENEIKAINDPMEVFAVVQSLPRKMVDANGLMDICFRRRNGLNHLTSELIDEQRADRKEKLQAERKEAMASAAASSGIQSAAIMALNRKETDMLTVDSADGGRRKNTLFGRGRGH